MRQYHNSVIENEIAEGIVSVKGNTKNTCLAFLREIKNFNIHDTRGGICILFKIFEHSILFKYICCTDCN
jgi:hypothetical protein